MPMPGQGTPRLSMLRLALHPRRGLRLALQLATGSSIGLGLLTGTAAAKAARCKTTDDGVYACQFRATDKDGSFEVTAPSKPTYMLNMSAPGVADGFIAIGSGNSTSLPGRYMRSKTEPACWSNTETKTSICVY